MTWPEHFCGPAIQNDSGAICHTRVAVTICYRHSTFGGRCAPRFFELALLLVRLDHVASFINDPDYRTM